MHVTVATSVDSLFLSPLSLCGIISSLRRNSVAFGGVMGGWVGLDTQGEVLRHMRADAGYLNQCKFVSRELHGQPEGTCLQGGEFSYCFGIRCGHYYK